MRKQFSVTFVTMIALTAAILIIGTLPAAAQEGSGVFKSEQGQAITPDQGVMEDETYIGAYDDDNPANDWWFDSYSYEEAPRDSNVRGYYSGEGGTVDWYNEDNYYTGNYDNTWDQNDWYFDSYDDTGNEGFWDF